jgi:hypothetical protein
MCKQSNKKYFHPFLEVTYESRMSTKFVNRKHLHFLSGHVFIHQQLRNIYQRSCHAEAMKIQLVSAILSLIKHISVSVIYWLFRVVCLPKRTSSIDGCYIKLLSVWVWDKNVTVYVNGGFFDGTKYSLVFCKKKIH